MGKSTTSYGLVVTLSDTEASTITSAQSAGSSAVDKLSLTAGGLLRDLAKGGLMIAPEWADRIMAAIGTLDTGAVVEAVEKAAGRRGEATCVEWVVDPTHVSFYQMQADNLGISLTQQLKSHLDLAYSQGWFGQTAPEPFKLLLTQGQYQRLQQMFAKDIVTGEDVVDRLLDSFSPSFAPEEDDLVLDSLKEK